MSGQDGVVRRGPEWCYFGCCYSINLRRLGVSFTTVAKIKFLPGMEVPQASVPFKLVHKCVRQVTPSHHSPTHSKPCRQRRQHREVAEKMFTFWRLWNL